MFSAKTRRATSRFRAIDSLGHVLYYVSQPAGEIEGSGQWQDNCLITVQMLKKIDTFCLLAKTQLMGTKLVPNSVSSTLPFLLWASLLLASVDYIRRCALVLIGLG